MIEKVLKMGRGTPQNTPDTKRRTPTLRSNQGNAYGNQLDFTLPEWQKV